MATTKSASEKEASDAMSIALQSTSLSIWKNQYRLTDKQGNAVEATPDETFKRVAKALCEIEPQQKDKWYQEFLWALRNGAIPAGRIMANVGALDFKPTKTTLSCAVSGKIEDSMDDILAKVHEAGLVLKAGSCIGYDFSTLRPKGAFVSSGAFTQGPISFMDIYDKMHATISRAEGRSGVQMASMDIRHPDIQCFIKAKRNLDRLSQFKLTLLINESFIQAVKDDEDWQLIFPITQKESQQEEAKDESHQYVWADWPSGKALVINELGLVACKVYRTLKARSLWNEIMQSAYDFAAPSIILIDTINQMNNNWFCEEISTISPCSAQPLPAYGSCILGSVDLSRFVNDPFTDKAHFDWDKYRKLVAIFTRMLDNLVELSYFPLEKQRQELGQKRRHGMGFLGLGTALTLLGLKYGSPSSIAFTEQVAQEMAITGWEQAVKLAKEKGPAPIMEQEFTISAKMLRQCPDMQKDGIKLGDRVQGKILHCKYSKYMQQIGEIRPDLIDALATHGGRFTHHSSIVPTKAISLAFANNASKGLEPSINHHYDDEHIHLYSLELLLYRHLINAEAMPNAKEEANRLPKYFVNADDITPNQYIDIQVAAQRWIDSSISKTFTVPTDFAFDEFKQIYMEAFNKGLKNCTSFRLNPEPIQGVDSKEEDYANTIYVFELENGTRFEAKGNEQIEYDGVTHTAVNLYNALRKGD